MDRALTNEKGELLSAAAFEKLPADARAARAPALACPECGAQAFFRRRTRDGRAPCFYSLSHTADCTIATPHTDRPRAPSQHVQRALDTDGHLRLRFGRGHPDDPRQEKGIGTTDAPGTGGQRARRRAGGSQSRVTSTGLGQLLDYLIAHPEFADADTFIETEDGYTWRARNLLRRFADADPDEEPLRPHLFFGPLTGASWDLNWLHTGRGQAVRIRARPLRPSVLEAEGLTHPAELAGSWVMVFGRCYRPAGDAPPYIEIHRQRGERRPDPAHLLLRME